MGSGPDLNINTILLFQQNWPTVVWYNLFDHGRPFLSLIPLSAECLRAISDKLGCTPIGNQICKKTPIFDEAPLSLSCHLSGATHYCYDKYENHIWMEALQKSDGTLDDSVQFLNISLLSRMGRRRGPIPEFSLIASWVSQDNIVFIGPESNHRECLSVTHWLTHSLPFSKLDWCDSGMWRWQLKTCWSCYCCWGWW